MSWKFTVLTCGTNLAALSTIPTMMIERRAKGPTVATLFVAHLTKMAGSSFLVKKTPTETHKRHKSPAHLYEAQKAVAIRLIRRMGSPKRIFFSRSTGTG